jgi:hypothetical protein
MKAHTDAHVLVVGRHPYSEGEYSEYVGGDGVKFKNINPTFKDADDVTNLIFDSASEFTHVIFQAAPPMVAQAMWGLACLGRVALPRIGFVYSVPGERPETQKREFAYSDGNMFEADVAGAVGFANPRARIDEKRAGYVEISVEPPMRFEFDRIEWVN